MTAKAALVFLVIAATGGLAQAEKVKVNQATKLYARQGEQSKVLLKIKAGEKVTLLGKDGRWLKVRSGGRTGYIPRSKADVSDDEEIARNTRRRPFVDGRNKDRTLGEAAPDDRTGNDAVGDSGDDGDKPDKADKADKPDKPDKSRGKGGKGGKPDKGDKGDKADKGDGDDGDDGDVKVADDEPKRPTAHVSGKTTIYSEKDKSSEAAFTASSDDVLFVNGKTSGKWTEVESSEGDLGYVLTSKLEMSDDGGEDVTPAKREIDIRARGGVTFVQQGLRTAGSASRTPPDNYNITVAAATLALGGTYLRPYNKDILIGGDFGFVLEKAVPGVRYTPVGGTATTTGFSVYDVDLRFVAGYDLHKPSGMMVLGRVGFRYDSFQVNNVGNLTMNPATLPSEIAISPAIGGGIVIPKVTPDIGLHFILDGMFSASMKQTKGLEDGKTPSEKGITFAAGLNYRYSPKIDIQAGYDLKYMGVSFGAVEPTSMRNHMGTAVTRTDISHIVTVGVAKAF